LYGCRTAIALAVALVTFVACAPAPPPIAPPTPTALASPTTQSTLAPPTQGSTVTTIDAVEQYFNPPTLTVPLGTSVQWRDLQGTHDVVAYDHSFASTVMFEGGTYSFTFTHVGHYLYVCTLHEGAGMIGEIVVEAP
jgi:plastocyanin